MTPKTEAQLNSHIDLLNETIGELKNQVEELEGEKDSLERKLENDDFGWSLPRKWEPKDLPVPRLEMYWERDDESGYNCRCTYMLVYEHYLSITKFDGKSIAGKDDPCFLGIPFGQTRISGSACPSFVERHSERHNDDPALKIRTPYRDSAHAISDATQLKLPLYITTEDGDVSVLDPKTKAQKMLKIAGKAL